MTDEHVRSAPARGLKQALAATLITQNLRYWLVAAWGGALAFADNWRVGVWWACVAAIAVVVRAEFEQRAARSRFRRPTGVLTIVATANSCLWALAPVLAWQTGQTWPQMIAVAMVMADLLLVFTQFGHVMRAALLVAAPYLAVAVWFAINMRATGEFWPFMVCIMVIGTAIRANVLFWRVNRGLIDRYQSRQASLIGELREARDVANAASAAKSAFLAMISHELRTPMNGVLGAAQLLDDGALAPAQQRYVEMIRTSGDALLSLLNDVLDFAKIESGRIDLEAIEVDLPALIERVSALWSTKAQIKGLSFAVEIAPQTPRLIVGDPTRLSQVVHNLLSNAIKFTDAGEVRLSLAAQPLAAGRARIAVAVSDTGVGIAAADQARLFQPFSQLDTSTTRRYGGTGLGLAISRRLAEAMGGALHCVSEPGRGAVFTLTAEVTLAEPEAAGDVAGADAAAPVRALNVLIAEDHPVNRQLVTLWLEAEGHRYACAENGQAAVEQCAGQAFDVILMDVNMPVMDGLSAVRAIRDADGPNRTVPIIMLSASARDEDLAAGSAAGADAYVSKPIDFTVLRATLARFGGEPMGPVDKKAA